MPRRPTTRKLLLDLMLAVDPAPLTAGDAVLACEVFGMSESSARVTLTRLTAAGLAESSERGSYRLSAPAHQLAREVAGWRHMASRLRAWQGDYLCVHTAALGRSDRAALTRRERALAMLGLRPLERDLYLRPNNIESDTDAVRSRLRHLGLDADAVVFVASDFGADHSDRISGLWDTAALDAAYRRTQHRLTTSLRQLDAMPAFEAARESFLLGGEAIRQLVFDPLLPDAMIDDEARRALLATTRAYDAAGQMIWQRLFEQGQTSQPVDHDRTDAA